MGATIMPTLSISRDRERLVTIPIEPRACRTLFALTR
jgi:hypothetical protein